MTLEDRFAAFCLTDNMISENSRILLALSGGKDSVCLFLLLVSLKKRLDFTFGACHVHHGIRGGSADRDAAFCRALCRQHQIPFHLEQIDVPAIAASRGKGLEETAREERYRALYRIAEEEGYTAVATAHTKSDQSETVLFHLLRGTGMNGLRGINRKTDRLIRPLLPFSSAQILSYLDEKNQSYCFDETNDDPSFSRNLIRRSVLPALTKVHPGAENALIRLSEIADRQNALVAKLCDRLERENGISFSSDRIPLSVLSELAADTADHPILFEALSRMTKRAEITIDFERFNALCRLLNHPETGKIMEISGLWRFRFARKVLILERHETSDKRIEYQQTIAFGQPVLIPTGQVLTCSFPFRGKVENINKKHLIIQAAFDKIKGDLFVRNLRSGDRIVSEGMHKLAKKCLQEAGVCAEERKSLPVICDDLGIVWLPFYGLCDRVRHSDTDLVIRFTLSAGPDFDRQNYPTKEL